MLILNLAEYWFSCFCSFRRISLTNGIVTAGSGFGTIAMGPLMQLVVNRLGWGNSTRVLAGVLCLCTIGSLLYRIPSQAGQEKVEKAKEAEKKKRPPIFDFTVFKNKAFLVWCLSLSAFMMGYFVPFVHLVSFCPFALGPVPERPIGANPGLKFFSTFCIYLHMHCLE